jgi:hypothetical protein
MPPVTQACGNTRCARIALPFGKILMSHACRRIGSKSVWPTATINSFCQGELQMKLFRGIGFQPVCPERD